MTFRKSSEISDFQVKKYLMSLEGMATHSHILAWRILWTEEPGRIQSMGAQTVSNLAHSTQILFEVSSCVSLGGSSEKQMPTKY